MLLRNRRHPPSRAALTTRMECLCPSVACLPIAAVLLGLGASPVVQAATIVVNSTADQGNAGTCTLRQAIVSMNTGAVTGNCVNTGAAFESGDTINFANSMFASGTPTIDIGGELSITHPANGSCSGCIDAVNLTIDAGAGRNVVVQRAAGAPSFSVIDASIGYGPTGSNGFRHTKGSLHLSGLTVRNGIANNGLSVKYKYHGTSYGYSVGGGILSQYGDVTLDRCTIANNHAGHGGGVWVLGGGLVLNSTTVSGNTAQEGSRGGWGGGVFSVGPVTINNSTISGNASNGLRGGAVASWTGPVNVVDSTVSGNTAFFAAAAISVLKPYSPITVLNSTIACNDTFGNGSAISIYDISQGSISVISSVLADTSNARCSTQTTKEIVVGSGSASVGGDHNLVVSSNAISSSAPFPSGTLFGDPLLGPLQNNGGGTSTHALGAGSPALESGSNPATLAYDQRGAGNERSVGKAPDIGAYEDQTSHLCGSASGAAFISLTSATPNLCGSGAYLQGGPFGSGPWSWFCASSSNPGNNEFCSAQVSANASLLIENASGNVIGSAIYGQPLHLKAVVADGRSPPSSTPTGAVSFFDASGGGFAPICVNLSLSAGSALCDTTNRPIESGSRQLKAVYAGSGTFGTATSSPGSIQINPAGTTTVIASQTPSPVALGSAFTVVAQVHANSPSVAVPIGTVEIDDQTDDLTCTYELGGGTPGCALTPASAGTHTLRVAYLGNGNMDASAATGTQIVTAPLLSLSIDDGLAVARYGQALQYAIHLTNAGNGAATNVAVTGTPSANFAGAPVSWQCAATNGATCMALGSGALLSDTVTLPADSSLTWTASVTVPQNAAGESVEFSANAMGVATVSDADVLVIFSDGFQ